MSSQIAVLIPCLNEEKTVAKVVSNFRKSLPKAKIYVYDNDSEDNTVNEAKKSGAIVKIVTKRGKGNVVKKMFQDIEADCYLLVDGDDTYMADSAKLMCEKVLNEKADMVIGDRLSSNYFSENKSMFRGVGNRVIKLMINKAFKSDIQDVLTGCRVLSQNFVKKFPAESEGFEVETEMTTFALANNLKIAQVPIKYRDRREGSESKIKALTDGRKIIIRCISDIKKYKKKATSHK